MLLQIYLTKEEVDALGEALDLAHADQEQYLNCGDPSTDYGDEWEWAANRKAALFRKLGTAGEKLGFHGERERWEALATTVLETLEEG